MEIVFEKDQLAEIVRRAKFVNNNVAFVPTMGFLHEGHLSLVRIAKKLAKKVVVSIFVNPLQFNNREDFEKYPINMEGDIKLLEQEGVDILYTPGYSEIYPEGSSVRVYAGGLSELLEGPFRPGHFDGVTTVVSILFHQVMPDIAVFGEKDFQQLRIIENLVKDLSFPIQIIKGPVVRTEEGLALSSRNSRLSNEGRATALALSAVLNQCQILIKNGLTDIAGIKEQAIAQTLINYPGFELEYLEIVNQQSLLSVTGINKDAPQKLQGLIAGYVEKVRLIDTQEFVVF